MVKRLVQIIGTTLLASALQGCAINAPFTKVEDLSKFENYRISDTATYYTNQKKNSYFSAQTYNK